MPGTAKQLEMGAVANVEVAPGVLAHDSARTDDVLARARAELDSLLIRLRVGRETVEGSAMRDVKFAQDKLREVSSITEVAAMNIMDGCDRALSLVDELETGHAADDIRIKQADTARTTLRHELYAMMDVMQFQDITSQQLAHATALLDEMERRITSLGRIFDPSTALEEVRSREHQDGGHLAFDTKATMDNADVRQAVADEIFSPVRQTL